MPGSPPQVLTPSPSATLLQPAPSATGPLPPGLCTAAHPGWSPRPWAPKGSRSPCFGFCSHFPVRPEPWLRCPPDRPVCLTVPPPHTQPWPVHSRCSKR